uniref:Putative ixodes 26 kDa salivary protein n=1 Tax=Ixodes ricinus TaxID=34613 RepID=A0A0K8RMJ8_IXORI
MARLCHGGPALALCVLCFVAQISTSTVSQKKVSFEGARNVTIAYRLDGNGFKYATEREISTVKVWLQEVQYQAELNLKEKLSVTIDFRITDLQLADTQLTGILLNSTSMGSCGSGRLIHAGTVLGEMKKDLTRGSVTPNIMCVITKEKLYQDNLADLLGYTLDKTLCYSTVPMILTYDRSQGRINETGILFAELVLNSTSDDIIKEYAKNYDDRIAWKQYFNVCNKKNNRNKYSGTGKRSAVHLSQVRRS